MSRSTTVLSTSTGELETCWRRAPDGTSQGPSATLAVARVLGTVVVSLHGEIDGSGSTFLAAVLGDLINGQGNRAIVVDLGGLRHMDAAAVEVLAGAAHQTGRRGGDLWLRRPNPQVLEELVASGLEGLMIGSAD